MKVLYKYCEKGNGKYNEDVLLADSNIVCVIDGATDVFPEKHTEMEGIVYLYVNKLAEMIMECYDSNKSISEIIQYAAEKVWLFFNKLYHFEAYAEYELPTYSISCIKKNNMSYEYFVLGDCFLALKNGDGVKLIKDERVKKFSKYNRDEMKRLGLNPQVDYEAMEVYKKTRMKANTTDGYPIGSVRGTGLKNAFCGEIGKEEVQRILLFSDGFIDYLEERNVDIINLFDEDKLEKIIEKADVFYADGEEYCKQLRPKQVDDRTIVLLDS